MNALTVDYLRIFAPVVAGAVLFFVLSRFKSPPATIPALFPESVVDNFLARVGRRISVDASKRQIALTFVTRLRIVLNGQDDCIGHRQLILGRRGVGKTRLLTELVDAAVELFPRRVLPVRLVFEADQDPKYVSPLDVILRALNLRRPDSVEEVVPLIERTLTERRQVAVLVLDELQEAYKFPDGSGATVAYDLSRIGNARTPRIMCFLTGSSRELRRLVFAELDPEAQRRYPSYKSVRLNSTKVVPVWIFPVLDPASFHDAVERICRRGGQRRGRSDVELFITSGGNLRSLEIELFWGRAPSDATSLHPLNDAERTILDGLLQLSHVRAFGASESMVFSAMDWETVGALESTVRDLTGRDFIVDWWCLFDMADAGLVRLNENQSSKLVGWGSPHVLIESQHRVDGVRRGDGVDD